MRWVDLYVTGDDLQRTLERMTYPAVVLLPAGEFRASDFRYGSHRFGVFPGPHFRGFIGAGIDKTVVGMRSMSSTKAARVPPQSREPAANPLYFLRTAPHLRGLHFEGFTLEMSDQGHMYQGIMVDHAVAPTMVDVKTKGGYGDWNVPPGETYHVNFWGCTDAHVIRVEGDGRDAAGVRQSASPMGINSCRRTTLDDCYFHHTRTSMLEFWQSDTITTNNLRGEYCGTGSGGFSAHQINHERCTGPIRHNSPVLIADRWHGPVRANTGLHMSLQNDLVDNPDVIVRDATWDDPGLPFTGAPFTVMIGQSYSNGPGLRQQQRTPPKLVDLRGNPVTHLTVVS